ncbi:MAG TPA: hypothetical protein VKY40_04785, partial [Halanaerobiales bacterium]|nr:hypothetical protein [Halanaerobiales bacterium]
AAYAIKLQDYRVDIRARLKGVNVEGEFEPDTVQGWLNNKFAPDGYAYLIPISNSKAHLVIAYPEYPGNQLYDSKKLLNNFLDEASNFLNQEFRIKDHFEINNYIIGICNKPRIGNTFFVGNNFGAIMPFLGFGQTPSLLTGIYAALDITGKGTYEKLIQPLKNSYSDSLTLRKTLEKMNNKQLDLFVRSLKGKAGQKLFTGGYNYLKVAAKILKPFISNKTPDC